MTKLGLIEGQYGFINKKGALIGTNVYPMNNL